MLLPPGFSSEEQYLFPNILNVCVFKGACTANCVHCPLGRTEANERKNKFGDDSMKLALFKKIVDEISRYPHSTLRIHGVGEPFLWKDLTQAIDYAHSKNILSWLFTNAITKDKHLLEEIVSRCNIVEISVNSYEPQNYIETKGVDAFSLVKENIEYMHDFIDKNQLKTRLLVSRVESSNPGYDQEFLNFWRATNWVNDVFIRSYHSYNGIIEDRNQKGQITACHVHWGRFNIDTTGEVVVCYNELFRGSAMDKSLVLGNINKQTIAEIWHGEKLTTIRQSQIENKPELVKFTSKLPCLNCQYCQPLNSDRVKSEVQIDKLANY